MHLAALVRRTHFIGTYFAEHVGVVGGGPPSNFARTKTVRLKATSTMSFNTGRLTVCYDAHGTEK